VLLAAGAWGRVGPVAWRLMMMTRSALATSSVVIGLGEMPVRLMPRSARAVTTVGLRASAGSVPAESACTPGAVGVEQGGGDDAAPGVVGADKQHPPLRYQRGHGRVSWLAAWVGCPPWVWRVQVWAAIWTAFQGLPNGGV
jgi:hypothetical protein